MDEDNLVNQEPLEKQKLEQLENELESIDKRANQKVPPEPGQPIRQPDTSQPESPILSEEPKPQGLGKSKGIYWIGIVLLILSLVGVGAYYLGSRNTASTPSATTP